MTERTLGGRLGQPSCKFYVGIRLIRGGKVTMVEPGGSTEWTYPRLQKIY